MGKHKQPEPEPEKIIRVQGENLYITVTEEEKKYRNQRGPDDVKEIKKEKLKCTVCAKSVADILKKGHSPYVHHVLGVLMCKDCASFYGDGYFSTDEDGDDKYCRWCGQGGTLYLCSSCSCAFCKKCIKQNLDRQDVKNMELDDWKCLVCNPKPLFECRTICWALQQHAEAVAKQGNENEEEEASTPSSSDRKLKRKKSTELPTSSSKKRKASEMNDEAEPEPEPEKARKSKRQRRSEGEEKKPRKSIDTTTSGRKSRRLSVKDKNDSESEYETSRGKNVTKSKKRRGSQPEENLTPSKKSSRKSKKQEDKSSKNKTIAEITISDDEGDDGGGSGDGDKNATEEDSKRLSKRNLSNKSITSQKDESSSPKKSRKSRHEIPSQENEEEKDTPKRTVSEKSTKTIGSPKGVSRNKDKKSKESPTKNKRTKVNEVETNLTKHSERPSRRKHSPKEETNVTDSVNSSFDDEKTTGRKSERKKMSKDSQKENMVTSPVESELSLANNVDKTAVQASTHLNSALKDVIELGDLMSNRCEKLHTKNIQSSDDILNVFSKLKQLMEGIHTNLELIEKGLDAKINEWREAKLEDSIAEDDKELKAEAIESEKEIKERIIVDNESVSNDKINSIVCDEVESKGTKESKTTEVMEVDEEICIKESKTPEVMEVNEEIEAQFNEKMVVSNDTQDKINKPLSLTDVNNMEEIDIRCESHEDEKSITKLNDDTVQVTESTCSPENVFDDNLDKSNNEDKESDTENKSYKLEAKEEAVMEESDQTTPASDNENMKKNIVAEDEVDDKKPIEENVTFKKENINDESVDFKQVDVDDIGGNNELNDKEDQDNSRNNEVEKNSESQQSENKCEDENISGNNTHEDKNVENTDAESVNISVVSNCVDVSNSDSIESVSRQSSVVKANDSQNNGIDFNLTGLDKEDVLDKVFSDEQVEDEKVGDYLPMEGEETKTKTSPNKNTTKTETEKEEKVSLEQSTIDASPAKQTTGTEDIKNGSTDDKKSLKEKEEDKKKDRGEAPEQRCTEKKEEKKVLKTPIDEQQSGPKPHQSHSPDQPRRLSGDRGRYNQDGSRWSSDRGRDWNRYQDRWSGSRGGSWNRYDDRRPNRGGWWNR